jgi:hypothetical protein
MGGHVILRKPFLTAIVVALIGTTAISSSKAQDNPQAAPRSAPAGMRIVTIKDPALEMTAYSLNIPENWVFQGTVVEGTFCVPGPLPVFRVSAPDGLTGVKWFPRLDWSWPDDPVLVAAKITSNCLPYKHEMSASDFLKNMLPILQVEYVKDLPTPNLAALQKNAAANNTNLITTTVDAANFQVRYHINQIEIEEHLNAVIFCTTDKTKEKAIKYTCSASLGRSWAPQGKWSQDTFSFTQHSLAADEKWTQAVYWEQHPTPEEIKRRSGGAGGNLDEGGHHHDHLKLVARLQAQALRKKQYGEFLSSLQRDSEMKVVTASAETVTRMPDDWCDYALDREAVHDSYIGDAMPVPGPLAFNYTWVNEKGEQIQSKNLNDNPNGKGTGSWTLQENAAKK